MNAEQKRSIKSTILECRNELEKDIEQVLISYGIYKDKEWVKVRSLKHLTEEEENIREKVEQVINKLEKGGFTKEKSVEEYIKEVSYTYLNRLAALRVMEVRGLIDEIIVSKSEYGNKSFIGNRFYEVAREYCKLRVDGGLAYLLNIMFEEISQEIKILFSMEDEYSFISPSSSTLLKVIDILCNKIDYKTWEQDEIIGWIYQYFNDKEKADVFDRLYNKKQKIKVEDVPAATQLFTPDWIVEWIVDNSLGALWSDLKQGKVDGKKIEEIKVLDPCCGSGHFLVKAYDLLYKMYVEEGLYDKSEIPFKILENNIYGIDIDLRAIQLTGLILFIKTKTYLKNEGFETNTKDKLTVNLACADAILLNGSRLESLKEKHKGNKTILKMIEIIYEEFKDVRLKGSLIQPEKKLFPLFEEHKHRAAKKELDAAKRSKKKQTKGQVGFIEEEDITLSEYKSSRDFTKEEKELIDSLNTIYNEAIKANDISRQLFANEAFKSIKLVDIFMNQYDVIMTNPPYMGKRSMTDKMKDFLKSNYGDNFIDLYSSFIDRCLDFSKNNGYIGMITQHSFMFTSSFTTLRKKIIDEFFIYKLCHLGRKAFSDISGEKVNTVMFIFNKNVERKSEKGEYIRLVNYDNTDDKENALKSYKKDDIYNISQDNFKKITNYPFTYWASDEIFKLFNECKMLEHYAKPKQGMATGNNSKYLRFEWELNDLDGWNKYSKVIDNSQYYTYYPTYILWDNNGEEIRKDSSSAIRGEEYFFKEGVMYSLIGNRFKSRYLPKGIIFDKGNSCIFPEKFDIYYLLALTNSKLYSYIINILNPTHNFQVGDIKRIPIVEPDEDIVKDIKNIISSIIDIRKELLRYTELHNEFKPITKLYMDFYEYAYEILYKNIILNLNIKLCEEKIDSIINDLYKVSEKDKINIQQEIEKNYFDSYMWINENYELEETVESIDLSSISNKKFEKIKETLKNNGFNIYATADEESISVFEVVKIIREYKLYDPQSIKDLSTIVISYCIGKVIDSQKSADDIILPIDSSIYLESDFVEQIYMILCEIFGDENADQVLDNIENILGRNLEDYLIKQFFVEHKKKYEKRPIYWHICSDKKNFNCFVYYNKLNKDTLYKVKNIYLGEMIQRYDEDLKYYNNQLIEARVDEDKKREKDIKNKCEDLELKLEDLRALDKKITEILPYKPDLKKGVLYNVIPIESILSSRVSTDKELENYYKEVKK